MLIDNITIESLEIPFRESFKHSSAERKKTQTVLVKAHMGEIIGYGEGCPREYVTNESIASCLDFFEDIKSEVLRVASFEELQQWVSANTSKIDQNPAGWCAVETAILDAIGKQKEQSIDQLLGLPDLEGSFQYSAIIGDSNIETTTKHVAKYIAIGFRDFKIKITGDPKVDNEKIAVIANQLKVYRVRLDANNLWETAEEFNSYFSKLNYPIFAVEEPLKVGRYDELQKIIDLHDIHIILDESFTNQQDFEKLQGKEKYIINLRISKMGGLIRSKQICEMAQHRNVPIIIGAQVGETSILTRCAISMANAFKTNLIAQEGAYGIFLLEEDITKNPIMFGAAGIIEAENVIAKNQYGLGIAVETMV